jgi:hypothetical protein
MQLSHPTGPLRLKFLVLLEIKTFFERRGRESYAEDAKKKQPNFCISFLRPLRILRVLCVQKGILLSPLTPNPP